MPPYMKYLPFFICRPLRRRIQLNDCNVFYLNHEVKLIHSVTDWFVFLLICEMAAALDPDEVLRSTTGKANFQRLTRPLISGGTALLRETSDQICRPSVLPMILSNPATKKQLKSAKLTKPQWDCLYPSPGVYGKSTDFDITLLFRLLRTICNLPPPPTG